MNTPTFLLLFTAIFAVTLVADAQSERSTPADSFHDVWYREVMLGDFEDVRLQYYRLYMNDGVAAADRESAAYRAGRCLEILEKDASAAYLWVVDNGRKGASSRQLAMQRLRHLRGEGRGSSRAEPRRGSSVRLVPGVRNLVDDLRRVDRQRSGRFRKFEGNFSEVQLRSNALHDVLERLRHEGVDLVFDETGSSDQMIGDVRPVLDETRLAQKFDAMTNGDSAEWESLKTYLSDRFFEKGLTACLTKNVALCRRDLSLSLALRRDHTGATEFLKLLEDLCSLRSLAHLARSRLEGRQLRQTATVRQKLRRSLELVDESNLRLDHRVRELEEARRLIEWAPSYVLFDPEVVLLVESLRYRYVRLGDTSSTQKLEDAVMDQLEDLWKRGRSELAKFLRLAETWIDLVREEESHRNRPLSTGDVPAAAIGRKVRREFDVELARLPDPPGLSKSKRRLELTTMRDFLETWFPNDEVLPFQRFRSSVRPK